MTGRPAAWSGPARRPQMLDLASSFDKLEAILTSPITYALAEVIPAKPRAGRPRDYPTFMWIVYLALVNFVWESARRVEAEISRPEVSLIQTLVRERFPDDRSKWLPDRPMRRHHFLYATTYLRDPAILEQMKTIFRKESCTLAEELHILRDGPTSWTHPDPDRFLHADGKVVTPLYRAKRGTTRVDRSTGEIRKVRADPDARSHVEGGGAHVHGSKFVLVAARNEHSRLLLDIEHDAGRSGDGGEAGAALRCFDRLAPLVPGAQGVIYDQALRGKHIDHLMRDLGWLTITGVHATKDREGERAAKFVEEVDAADRDGGGERLQIYAREGAAGLAEVTETGETTFVPITRVKTERRADAQRFRWYNVYALPEEHGGGEVRIRLTGNEEDERRKLNRAERLRAIPPPDPDFPALFRRRNDAESLNRGLEDTLYWRRAHSVGARAQEADLIGFGLGMNALAAFRHTKRGSLASAA